MSMTDETNVWGTLLLVFIAAAGLLLLIFFFPLFLVILRVIGVIACLLVGLVLLLVLAFGLLHLVLIPYYALKKERETSRVYEGTYRIEDARDAGTDERKGEL